MIKLYIHNPGRELPHFQRSLNAAEVSMQAVCRRERASGIERHLGEAEGRRKRREREEEVEEEEETFPRWIR